METSSLLPYPAGAAAFGVLFLPLVDAPEPPKSLRWNMLKPQGIRAFQVNPSQLMVSDIALSVRR
jgi:hypothetical protein